MSICQSVDRVLIFDIGKKFDVVFKQVKNFKKQEATPFLIFYINIFSKTLRCKSRLNRVSKLYTSIINCPELYVDEIEESQLYFEDVKKDLELVKKNLGQITKTEPSMPFSHKMYEDVIRILKCVDIISKMDVEKLKKRRVDVMYHNKCITTNPTPIIMTMVVYAVIIAGIITLIVEGIMPMISGIIVGGLVISFFLTAFDNLKTWRNRSC